MVAKPALGLRQAGINARNLCLGGVKQALYVQAIEQNRQIGQTDKMAFFTHGALHLM